MRKELNKPDFFWKNWRLGTEVQISGTFIYNALYFLDTLDHIQNEEDIFEFLYNLSIGIERLQKIAIVLLEHDENTEQQAFEKSLITHDHLLLHHRITLTKEIKLGKVHFKFLNLLRDFYTSYRYERFNKNSVYKPDFDKKMFQEFLYGELKIKTSNNDELWYPYHKEEWIENSIRVKKFIGKIVGKIVSSLYEIISNQAREIGTFTYEIRYGSKAYKIFMAEEYTFEKETNFKKEILIQLMNKDGFNDAFSSYVKSLVPLGFDETNSSYYMRYLLNSITNSTMLNEYDYMIDEKNISNDRKNDIEPIGLEIYLWDSEDDNDCADSDD